MKDLLLPRHRSFLERFLSGPVLLAFDYDGTLAPIIRDPVGAPLRASTRRLLQRLSECYPCALVSGRSHREAARVVDGAVPIIVGNHGFDLGRPVAVPDRILGQVRRWRDRFRQRFAGEAGVYVEDKGASLAIHFGMTRRWRSLRQEVYAEAGRCRGARLVPSWRVLNVIPRSFPTKGDAILALLRAHRLRAALYAGDDVTDEDVFALGLPRVLGVHVGPGRSRADFCLRRQDRIDELLELLLQARSEASRSRRAAGRRRARASTSSTVGCASGSTAWSIDRTPNGPRRSRSESTQRNP